MIKRRLAAALVVVFISGGCGDKMPQSEAAKSLGDSPRQTVDKAASDTARAMQKGAERIRSQE